MPAPERPLLLVDGDGPTLLVTTEPATGLTEAHAAQLEAWASSH